MFEQGPDAARPLRRACLQILEKRFSATARSKRYCVPVQFCNLCNLSRSGDKCENIQDETITASCTSPDGWQQPPSQNTMSVAASILPRSVTFVLTDTAFPQTIASLFAGSTPLRSPRRVTWIPEGSFQSSASPATSQSPLLRPDIHLQAMLPSVNPSHHEARVPSRNGTDTMPQLQEQTHHHRPSESLQRHCEVI